MEKIKNFWHNLKRSCRWFKRMWNNYDFDSYFLIQMMVDKMKDMRYQFDYIDAKFVDLRHQPSYNDSNIIIDSIAELDKAIEVGERLLDDDYFIQHPDVEKWLNENPLLPIKMPDDIKTKFMKAYYDAKDAREKDNILFFNLISQNHENWWT